MYVFHTVYFTELALQYVTGLMRLVFSSAPMNGAWKWKMAPRFNCWRMKVTHFKARSNWSRCHSFFLSTMYSYISVSCIELGVWRTMTGFGNPGTLQENKNEETMKRMSFMYHIQDAVLVPRHNSTFGKVFIGIIKPLQTLPPLALPRL